MKVRDSGMPVEQMWQDFFKSPAILSKLGFANVDGDAVDFGCGFGTFTIAAAASGKGTVHAFDLDPEMIAATTRKAEVLRLTNVRPVLRDFIENGVDLLDASVTYAMLFNILHAERPLPLIREAFRDLAPRGKLAAVHWIHDASTPRGPALSIRPGGSCAGMKKGPMSTTRLPRSRRMCVPPPGSTPSGRRSAVDGGAYF